MRYSPKQIEAVTKELQNRFVAGEVKNYEIVVTLIAMSEAGRISQTDIKDMLYNVFFGNPKGITRALEVAKDIIDKDLIDTIVKEVNHG
jgi:hypothetical protein